MVTINTSYLANLRTEVTHIKSGNKIITDAPVDNKGKGEYFSPTDMFTAALASCIFTIMGIAAREHGFSIDGASCKTTKVMVSDPRRIGQIIIEFDFTDQYYTSKQKKILDHSVKNCPVSRSIHPELIQDVSLNFKD
jgi:uncharacterized OsmC-like protein